MSYPLHPPGLDYFNYTGEGYKLPNSSLCSFPHLPVTSFSEEFASSSLVLHYPPCLQMLFIILRNKLAFYGEGWLAPRPTRKLEDLQDNPLSFVRDCLFNIFAVNLHSWRPSLHPQPEDAPYCCWLWDPSKCITVQVFGNNSNKSKFD
jgi:hypothetical protein